MKIPDRERVAYGRAPLLFAGCQISFPRLLDLEQQLPVDFQRAVSERFPLVEVGAEDKASKTYHFSTAGSEVFLSLSSEGLFLGTSQYQRWEVLRNDVILAVSSFVEIYRPPFLTRIAVRYQNVVDRDEIELADVDWSELIAPHVAGLFMMVPTSDVHQCVGEAVISLELGSLKLRYGLAISEGKDRTGFLIDCEVFDDNQSSASVKDVIDRFNQFNRDAGRAFRWCITDRLHDCLQPSRLPDCD
jgi:uncharacterized protein (TIGR04255 family)